MARIIPWKLPDVKGGSIGGYTPRTDDATPDPLSVHYDFTDALFKGYGYDNLFYFNIQNKAYTAGSVADATTMDNTSLSGVTLLDAIGVSSLSCVLECTSNAPASYEIVNGTIVVDLDPVTMIPSGCTAQAKILNNTTIGQISAIISKMTFVVYNGDGEIIQTQEITVGE